MGKFKKSKANKSNKQLRTTRRSTKPRAPVPNREEDVPDTTSTSSPPQSLSLPLDPEKAPISTPSTPPTQEEALKKKHAARFEEDLQIIQSQTGLTLEDAIQLYQNNQLDPVQALSAHWCGTNQPAETAVPSVSLDLTEAQQQCHQLRVIADDKDKIFTHIQKQNKPAWQMTNDTPQAEKLENKLENNTDSAETTETTETI